jgi:hypothetical protein
MREAVVAGRAIQQVIAGAVRGRSLPRGFHITDEDALKRMARSYFWREGGQELAMDRGNKVLPVIQRRSD